MISENGKRNAKWFQKRVKGNAKWFQKTVKENAKWFQTTVKGNAKWFQIEVLLHKYSSKQCWNNAERLTEFGDFFCQAERVKQPPILAA